MVNPKRIEQKLPLLISDGPSWGWDYGEKEWWLMKLKRNSPDQFASHRNRIINDFEALERDVMNLRSKKMGRNGNSNGNGNGHR
jgi:hypothetical protein